MSRFHSILPNDRKQFFAVWHGLPEDKEDNLYKAFQRKRYLMMLWGLGEILSYPTSSLKEKIHLLLAYKYLDWAWFTALPASEDEPFTIYICDEIPEDQGPDDVNDTFDMSPEELHWDCKDIEKPEWAKQKSTKRVRVTIQSFPYEA